jgi:DNA-3-methyladenine glycosylase II
MSDRPGRAPTPRTPDRPARAPTPRTPDRPAPRALDAEAARRHLCAADRRLAALVERVGPFGLNTRPAYSTFRALAEAIVHQQLSLGAAATIVGRVRALYPDKVFPGPRDVLATDEAALRGAGLSRAKAAALYDLAQKSIEGVVPPSRALDALSDDEIVARLTAVRGVGRWTVEMLLIFRLGRPDVWPVDDYGLRKGYALTFGWASPPSPRELLPLGERLRPYRTAAAWYLWRAVELENEAAKRAKQAAKGL